MSDQETIPFTADGLSALTEELRSLKEEQRPQVIEDIAEARAHGDLKENAEYHAAREKQGFIEARIKELEGSLSRAKVIDFSDQPVDIVRFGSHVRVSDEETGEEKTLRIVGHLEADMDNNKISLNSPIAKALLGKKVDDLVEIKVPKGNMEYVILEIRY